MYQHANATPVPPSQRSELEIPAELDRIILACLAKYPEDRPQTAAELSRRLATRRLHRLDRGTGPPVVGPPPPGVGSEPSQRCRPKMLTKTMEASWEPVETPSPLWRSAGRERPDRRWRS